MKSTIIHSMKSVHLKIAFCGFLCLAVDSQWNAALGVLTPEEAAHRGSHAPAPHKPAPKPISKPPGLEQKNEPGPGQRRRRKSDPAPEAKGEGKEGPKPGVPGEARPHEAPKVGGEFHKPLPGKAFGIISERATLRFRHALFSHRWSFNYARGTEACGQATSLLSGWAHRDRSQRREVVLECRG
jgi:hypothetical protein